MSFLTFAWDWLSAPARWHGSEGIPVELADHLGYTGLSLLVAALIALPAGLAIGRRRRGGLAVVNVANIARAIPTLGLLVLVVVTTGLTVESWLIPLAVLAIPPILVNTYVGIAGVDPQLTDAARGMGMTGWQLLWKVEFPVALPLILLGLRTAAIFVVATATIAAYPGFDGLGRYIVDGLASNNYGEVAGGAAVIVVLALVIQAAFALLSRLVVPRGLRLQAASSR